MAFAFVLLILSNNQKRKTSECITNNNSENSTKNNNNNKTNIRINNNNNNIINPMLQENYICIFLVIYRYGLLGLRQIHTKQLNLSTYSLSHTGVTYGLYPAFYHKHIRQHLVRVSTSLLLSCPLSANTATDSSKSIGSAPVNFPQARY